MGQAQSVRAASPNSPPRVRSQGTCPEGGWGFGPGRLGKLPGMKMRRNLYAMLGMAAWKFGMPYAKKKMQARKAQKSPEAARV